jgi:hypothetical protein
MIKMLNSVLVSALSLLLWLAVINPDAQACDRPTNAWISQSSLQSATLSWSFPAYRGTPHDFNILTTEVDWSSDNGRTWMSVGMFNFPTQSTELMGLMAGQTYNFRLRLLCVDARGTASSSAYLSGRFIHLPCAMPTNLRLVSASTMSANISWDHATISGNGYEVNYRENIPNSNFIVVPSTASLSQTLSGLRPNTSYEVRVRTLCNVSTDLISEYTPSIIIRTAAEGCTAPEGLAVQTMANNRAMITWQAAPEAIQYEIWGNTSGNTARFLSRVNAASPMFTWQNLVDKSNYFVRVRSVCRQGNRTQFSAFSADVNFQYNVPVVPMACNRPTQLNFETVEGTQLRVTWPAVAGINQYELGYSENTGTSYTTRIITGNSVVLLNDLKANTRYWFRVRSNCTAQSNSEYFETVYQTRDGGQCLAPTGISVESFSTNQAAIVWNPSVGASIYRISWRSEIQNMYRDTTVIANRIELNNLIADQSYHIQVRTLCTNGVESDPITFRFNTLPVTNCSIPANIMTSEVRDFSVRMTWAANPNALNYLVAFRASHEVTFQQRVVTTNNFVLDGLNPNTQYQFKVLSRCAPVEPSLSDWSALMTFRTSGTLTNCLQPSAIRVVPGVASAMLHWNAVAGAQNYEVWLSTNNGQNYSLVTTTADNRATLADLAVNRVHLVRLRAICGPNFISEQTPPTRFIPLRARTGLEASVQTESAVLVYPNPTTGAVQLSFDAYTASNATIQVANTAGQIVFSQSIDIVAGSNQAMLDVSQLPKGIYFVSLPGSGLTATAKIILN